MAGCPETARPTSAETRTAHDAKATTQSTREITPDRMVMDPDPRAHGPVTPGDGRRDVVPDPPPDDAPARAGSGPAPPTGAVPGSAAGGAAATAGALPVPSPPPPPPSAPPPAAPPRRRRHRLALALAAFLVVAFVVGAAFVPLPYYLFRPGSVRDTEPLIGVEGAQVYPSAGSIGYTTVSLRQASLLGLVHGWLDD
ncbi:MAG TPA: hypothetical protein VFW63_13895, partial [Acidimicrobiales bacterium]|nr:hypothetical protein [Acidimicrobiales bacterium]